jgi:hypothetical protein
MWGADLDPAAVGATLALPLEASYASGDAIEGESPPAHREEGWATFSSHTGVHPDSTFDEHASWLLARLEPHLDRLAAWGAKGWRLRLDIITVMNVRSGGPRVSAVLLSRIASLKLETKWLTAFAPEHPGFRE